MHGDAAARKLVQRRKLARRQRRLRETGAVRDEETEARGDRGGMGGNDLAFRRTGAERDQHPVEPARFLRAGSGIHIVAVKHARTRSGVDFGGVVEADIADELYGHDAILPEGRWIR